MQIVEPKKHSGFPRELAALVLTGDIEIISPAMRGVLLHFIAGDPH